MFGMKIISIPRWIYLLATVAFLAPCPAQDQVDRVTLTYENDSSIKMVMKGRAGNLELKSSTTVGEGQVTTDYQQGSGFVAYDRTKQTLTSRTKTKYTLNRLSKNIVKKAPYLRAEVPAEAILDFHLDITNLGYGSLNFANLYLSRFNLDVNYGDVDVDFPTENQSIIRGTAKFHVMAGDLEIYNLANLKAANIKINGGVGELSVAFGPKLLQDTQVSLDQDIGAMELTIPRGTKAYISGTSRDLSGFEFIKNGNTWEPASFHPDSPRLEIRLLGPVGDLTITWQ